MDEIPPVFQGKRTTDPHVRKVFAIYCRISVDKRGRKEGVEKQAKWGRVYAGEHFPGVPVEIFSDNDLSAIDPNVIRPDFERLRVWVSEGRVAGIWVVEQTRFVRRPSEWFLVADELTAAGIDEIHTNRDGIVIVQDEVAGIKAVLGGGEVRRTKKRVADTLKENALQGQPPYSRPAGYRNVKVRGVRTYEVVEEEWRPRLWAAKAVLDGWSVENAAAELRALGIPGAHRRIIRDEDGDPVMDEETGEEASRPTELSAVGLRRWLTSPAIAGLRVHQKEIVGRGNWPPLLCDDPWADDAHAKALAMRGRLLAVLGRPREVTTKSGRTYQVTADVLAKAGRARRRYLLTGGKIRCCDCEYAIVAGQKQMGRGDRKRTVPYYWCTTAKGGGGCVGMMADAVERIFRDRLLEHVATDEFAVHFGTDPYSERREAILDELERKGARRAALAAQYAAEEIEEDEWKAAKAVFDEREAAIRAELATIPDPPPQDFDPLVLRDPRVWEAMTLGERRRVVDLLVEKVVLSKAKPPYNRIDESRLVVVWK
jgi:hypothetical protein